MNVNHDTDGKVYLISLNSAGKEASKTDHRYRWTYKEQQFEAFYDVFEEVYRPRNESHWPCYFYDNEVIIHREWFQEDE